MAHMTCEFVFWGAVLGVYRCFFVFRGSLNLWPLFFWVYGGWFRVMN